MALGWVGTPFRWAPTRCCGSFREAGTALAGKQIPVAILGGRRGLESELPGIYEKNLAATLIPLSEEKTNSKKPALCLLPKMY